MLWRRESISGSHQTVEQNSSFTIDAARVAPEAGRPSRRPRLLRFSPAAEIGGSFRAARSSPARGGAILLFKPRGLDAPFLLTRGSEQER